MKNIIFIPTLFFLYPILGQTSFQSYFDSGDITGSITLYNYQKKQWVYTDSLDAQKGTLPASTFKIINSLIAIEYGAISNENEVLKWDGKIQRFKGQPINAWNRDTNLKDAYKNSTVWFYVEIANRIGRQKYKSILKSCDYGNKKFSEKGADFWNYGDFAISPENQIDFLIRLYEENLPFTDKTIKTVEEIMISESTPNYTIRSKSGWAQKEGKNIGWWIGYIEKEENIYFFATRLIKDKTNEISQFGELREKTTRKILADLKML